MAVLLKRKKATHTNMTEVFYPNVIVKTSPIMYGNRVEFNIKVGNTTTLCVVEDPKLKVALCELQVAKMSILDLKGFFPHLFLFFHHSFIIIYITVSEIIFNVKFVNI